MKKILIISSILFFTFFSAFAQNLNQVILLEKNGESFTATDDLARFTATDDLARFSSAKIKHPKKGWILLSEMSKEDAVFLGKNPLIQLTGKEDFLSPYFVKGEAEGFLLEVSGLKMGPQGYYQYKLKDVKVVRKRSRRGVDRITLGYTEVEWTFMEKTKNGYTEVEWTYKK